MTDPKNPKYLAHIPGEEGNYEAGGAQMVRVCDGKTLPKGDPDKVYLLRPFGNQAHEIWDTTDPSHPLLVTRVVEGLKGTHKSWWECDTGIAYLVAGAPGWRVTRMTEVYDLSDPAHPVKIRDFGLAGQQPGADRPGADGTARHDRAARRPTASISAMAPTRAALCRSSTATSCCTGRRSRPTTICATPRSGAS